MSRTIRPTFVDNRPPVEPSPEPTLTEKFPIGCVVAYNGPSDDGESKRALVLKVNDDENSLELLDGANTVTVSGDALANVVILAASVDEFGLRFSRKARALGSKHGWCSVAEEAIKEINTTPVDADNPKRDLIRLVTTTVTEWTVLPTRRGTELLKTSGRSLGQFLADDNWWYIDNWGGEPAIDYIRSQSREVRSTTIEVVDELPSEVEKKATADAPA